MTDTNPEIPQVISDQAVLMLKLREMALLSRAAETVPIFRAAPSTATNASQRR